MNALWTHFRRLVASVMLVAVTLFVLHGGAMAGLHQHGQGSAAHASPASAGHVHQAAAHDHGSQAVHVHGDVHAHHHATAGPSEADVANDGPGHREAGAGELCCASNCATALAAFTLDAVSAPIGVAASLLPVSQDGVGMRPDGLKRPPRTPGIA